ncbi:multidrug resistance-associated protein 1-like [Planococcus citri]|uniref:multidrug resistance-associated protein 1-like n=1 Tax=Planococcus citri TaxID=170843 RepID=UPI0031F8C5C4
MDKWCKSTFWDSNLTWYAEDPEFTPCFRQTILVWIPCGFLWGFLPLKLYYLKKSYTRDIPYNTFNIIKLVFIVIATLLKSTDVVQSILFQNFEPPVYFYSTIVECFTLMLFLILTWANIKRGIRSSGILFCFSFLSVVCGIPEIKAVVENGYIFINRSKDDAKVSYALYYICIMVIFLMNCFADEKPRRSLRICRQNIYPAKKASFLSKLFLNWFGTYVWNNHKQPVKNYLWDLDSKDCAKDITTRPGPDPGLTKLSILFILHKEHGLYFWFITGLRVVFEVLTTDLFIIFDWLLSSLHANEPIWKAYFYASLFFVNILIQSVVLTKYTEHGSRVEIRVRNTVISCLYKKALLISNAVRKKYSTSDIVNLMSVDTFQLQNAVRVLIYFVSLCTQMTVSYLYLWYLLGKSVIVSILVVLGIFLAGYLLTKRMKQLQREEVKNKDIRSRFMQEIFSGIKVLKMYAWERSFEKVAINLRQTENKTLRKIAITNTLFQNLFLNSPFLSSLAAYASFVLVTQNVMDVRITFVSFVVFNYFRIAFAHIPQQLLFLQQLRISIKRMNEFLNSEELDQSAISHDATTERLIMQNASFSWICKDGPVTLENMNIEINNSELVAIIGPVGAGKSSLFSAFLGEMYKITGYVNTRGKMAYVPQQAWILNTTIRENINLGDDIDKNVYERTIKACALNQDLNELTDGDLTEIGEKGINLSGGQKQRISLARAVCQNADIYFFDDPLSAVDSNVANHIFQNVLGPNGLLKDKTRILVTHSTKFFPFMDKIIVLKNGCISEMGSYQELLNNEGEFTNFVRTHVETDKSPETQQNANNSNTENASELPKEKDSKLSKPPKKIRKSTPRKLIEDERVKSKQIDGKLYWKYFKAGGIFLTFVSLFMFAFFQTILMVSNVFLSEWVTSEDAFQTKYSFVEIYVGYGVVQVIVISLGAHSFYKVNVKACEYFYHSLLHSVLRWPMASFDSTPIGRIISRINDDVYTIDNFIAMKMVQFVTLFFRYFSIFVFMIITIPLSCIIIIPINIVYFIIRKHYIGLSHQLKRIETIHKSPLYSHLVETVTGIQTIRAFGLQEKFTSRCYQKIDLYSASYHSSVICTRWFCSRVEFLEGIILCSLTALLLFERNSLTLGQIALLIALALQMIRGIAYMSDVINEVEDGIIAVERISEYLAYPQEPDWDESSVSVSDTWPDKGEIIFHDYKLRYREGLDLVLKGISLTIKSGEKVGIVGRTGAGKTSIIQGLFRIVEPDDGTIFIDNVSIMNVGLHTLRSKLTVIPQDPILFYGTLRFNLDPFDCYKDEYLWNILEKSHLKNFVNELPGGLQHMIDEGGQNLSFGQRQLICLARALLRKSKVLVLDEATASVDVETDELIQKTIRDEFSDCTVITIAHRLNTIQDYDKILILDGGCVVNFDSAENLLNPANSQLRNMVLESGLQ